MSEAPPTSTALAKASPPPQPAPSQPHADISSGVFSGIAAFEAAQRMAQALCTSTMVPAEYRGQQGLSNSLIALEIAARMGLSPLVVMQNMTPIHGKPSWSSSFLIATVNASGRFSPLRFVFDDKTKPSSCYAVARDKASGEVLEGETISIEMAKREGWWSRPDRYGKETSKWQSMTGQMLRYRAAAFWVKVYCPEISLGLMTQEEVTDVQAVEITAVEPIAAASSKDLPQLPAPQVATTDSQTVPAPRRSGRRTGTTPKDNVDHSSPAATEAETPAAPPATGQSTNAEQQAPAEPEQESVVSNDAAQDPNSASELLTTALQEIPRLTSAAALENARERVNRLLAKGQLSDHGAERLWDAIDRRLRQLQASDVAAASQPEH